MKSLSIIIPAYNEGKTIEQNIKRLFDQLQRDSLAPRVLLVDDGSGDDTWNRLVALSARYPGVGCLRLSRNFGKEAAILAGIAHVETERYLIMDSDMQHPPALIPQFIRAMDETGANIVEGVKAHRGSESVFHKLFALGFYKLLFVMSGIDLQNSSDFKLLDRKAMDAMRAFQESAVFFRGLSEWSGFIRVRVPFQVAERKGDTGKFPLRRLAGMAANSILAFTSKPLYITLLLGLLFLAGAVILGVQTVWRYVTGQAVSGFTTLILLNLITGAFILICLGIIGVYISRIYNEVKRRPRYMVSDFQRPADGPGSASGTA